MDADQLALSFKDIIEMLPGHVYWLDRNNVFLGCNKQQAEFLGFKDSSEVIGKTNHDMFYHDNADTCNQINNRVMSSGQLHHLEEPVTRADGKELVFLSTKVPLRDNQGSIVGILGISFDITERKERERKSIEATRQSDIALENIIDQLPGHVYWLDRNNVFLGCNQAHAEAAGLQDRKEIVGKTNYDMPWCDQAEGYQRMNSQVMHSGQEYSIEELAKQADGKELIFISKKVPLRDDHNNIVGILGISFDITKQKAAEKALMEAKEQAELANRAKTQFLEEMRHDIRTPLSGIVGISELLNVENNQNKIKEYSKWLTVSSQELMRFLNSVLESVTSSSGQIPINMQRFNLRETIGSVVSLHQAKAFEKGLILSCDIDPKIPQILMGDSVRLYRIVLELLSNAIKFTEQGSVNVRVMLSKKTGVDMIVQCVVQDTGIGIPKEKQADLFARFNRLSPSYAGHYKGSGLGLSIAKTFSEDLGGELHIESDPLSGPGSRFILVLPLKEALLQVMPELDGQV